MTFPKKRVKKKKKKKIFSDTVYIDKKTAEQNENGDRRCKF